MCPTCGCRQHVSIMLVLGAMRTESCLRKTSWTPAMCPASGCRSDVSMMPVRSFNIRMELGAQRLACAKPRGRFRCVLPAVGGGASSIRLAHVFMVLWAPGLACARPLGHRRCVLPAVAGRRVFHLGTVPLLWWLSLSWRVARLLTQARLMYDCTD